MPLLTRTRPDDDQLAAARERAREASAQVADRAQQAASRAREVSEPTLDRALEASGPAIERAREVSAPLWSRVLDVLGTVLRLLVRVTAILPGIAARVLAGLSTGLGRLADRTAEMGEVEPPSASSRRSRRRRAVLWFVSGFATGAAAGYAANEYRPRDGAASVRGDDAAWPRAVPPMDEPPASTARPAGG